ncbi:MAG: hypothetical protein R6U70_09020 [Bacillota bacterium]
MAPRARAASRYSPETLSMLSSAREAMVGTIINPSTVPAVNPVSPVAREKIRATRGAITRRPSMP